MVETRSKSTKADAPTTEHDRVQRERRDRSPRSARPGLVTNDGALALPGCSRAQSTGNVLRSEAQPCLTTEYPLAQSTSHRHDQKDAKAPSKTSSVHSKQVLSERTRSSRPAATIRAQKLALEAEAMRRRVERERELARQQAELEHQQTERERKQAKLEFELARQQAVLARKHAETEAQRKHDEAQRQRDLAHLESKAEETELQARLAALDASDKSQTHVSNFDAERRTATWVSEQNANYRTTMTEQNMPGEAPAVTLRGLRLQPPVFANTAPFNMPVVDQAAMQPTVTVVDPAITQLSHAINALSNRPKKPELVTFSGDASQWMAFKSSYERTKANFSPSENLDRLNAAVRGQAYQAVASLIWTCSEPDTIVRVLEQTYARPELLVAREVAELRSLPKLSAPQDLNNLANKLRNFVTTLTLLNQCEYLSSPELFRCILVKLSDHTRARFTDFASTYVSERQNTTKLELLSHFLLVEADKQLKFNFVVDSTVKAPPGPMHPNPPRPSPPKFVFKRETVHATASSDKTAEHCAYCKQGPHNIKACKSFSNLALDDRWRWVREAKVCYRCLKANPHTWRNCRAKRCGVDGCPRRHNALLHGTETASANVLTCPGDININKDSKPSDKIANTTDCLINVTGYSPSTAARPRGLLKVVPIVIEGPDGALETTALLDEGSSSTLIEGEVAARIGAKVTGRERLRIEGVSGMEKDLDVSFVNFYIRGRNCQDRYLIEHAKAVTPLGLRARYPHTINLADYDHLSDLSDELVYTNVLPTVLIGAPDWHLSISREIRCGKKNDPVASKTLLGWVLHGAYSTSSKPVEFVNHVSEDLDSLIKSQYDIDALGIIKKPPNQNIEDQRAVDIIETSARQLDSGHFEVGLPWKAELPKIIPDSYPQALSRFKALERQMSKDSEFSAAFHQFIDNVISKDYAEECDPKTYHQRLPLNTSCVDPDGTIRWYLPIFGVFHPQKKKLRAVHDAAAVTKGVSVSLNSLLLQGPDLLSPLLGILFRFREGAVALNGDIKEMFPQVKIATRDRDAQRFLWRSKEGELKEYRMSSMIFGAVSSPFIALYIKNKNARMHETDYPAACKAIIDDHYMDDYLGSHSDATDAAQVALDVVTVHKAGGFEMRAWTSNHPEALSLVPRELRSDATSDVYLPPSSDVGVLGVKWNPHQDTLGFHAIPQIPFETLTKRILLSNVMKVYDPLGLLMPVVIWGRILIQRLWRVGIGWDTQLPESYITESRDWFAQLRLATNIKIPRWYKNESVTSDVQLHLVADGGEQAYACVAYWRFTYPDDTVRMVLIGSKARVAPLKPVSIPRLELQAALIATRFAQTIVQTHRLKPSATTFWTDSTTVLKWIRSDARAFKPFVAHRLGEILDTTNPSDWRWIPTSLNVADDATKPKRVEISETHRWFTGPQFLVEPTCAWPTERTTAEEESSPDLDPELKSDLVVLLLDTSSSSFSVPDPLRFSSWLRLLRATARVFQGARLFRLKLSRPLHPNSKFHRESVTSPYQLRAPDIIEAEKMLVRYAQAESFPEELSSLRALKPVPKNSRIKKLAPTIDGEGLLRLDTRISCTPDVNRDMKSPMILDGRHRIAQLIILHEHIQASHQFNELVLNELRQRYWILRARSTIRSIANTCPKCRRWKNQPAQPQTGDLPLERLDHHTRPFTHVGLDYFGPILVSIHRRSEKRYVALYTCLSTRALHLELVYSLTADSAILSLRRFIARRESPTTIISDNGTNFFGSARELRALYDDSMIEYATNHKINWRFIPPASPFMGGAWERLVRTVKTALRGSLSNQPLRQEVLSTLLLEAESFVNSRPITYVPSSPDSPEAITPFHFILGSSSVAPWTTTLTDEDLHRRCDWRRTLRLADHFWARWLREYLPTLRPRGAGGGASNLREGDVVFIADPTLPRGLWPLGRVEKVFFGPDGSVRVADVHTKGGVLRRPVRKLIVMEAAPQPVATRG